MGRKDKTFPLAHRAPLWKRLLRACSSIGSSSTCGTANGGTGFVEKKKKMQRRLQVLCCHPNEISMRSQQRHREQNLLPGVVMFTDCRALVQALDGSLGQTRCWHTPCGEWRASGVWWISGCLPGSASSATR
ncbi:hypothetical protein PoB_006058800 [Plakobranchus ocellatus]|uniref:Uncharacterized protein n=1 Tax=Plakobranchus ocellatus TaxID=259542 RepID=A0AAV4CQC8_9GAST|nr:hypothetical protein PoB_006058800 [Plakobranchus ocellatus]